VNRPGAIEPTVSFLFRKKQRLTEVNIRDAEIIVERYEPHEPHDARLFGKTGFTENKPATACVELSTKSEPLPWVFRPYCVWLDDKRLRWRANVLSLRDGFETPFAIQVAARDAGLYWLRIRITVSADFGVPRTIELLDGPRCFGFYDMPKANRTGPTRGSPLAPESGPRENGASGTAGRRPEGAR